MQSQFVGHDFIPADEMLDTMGHLSYPHKMMKEEKNRQTQKVKQLFPEETGTIKDDFFSSRVSPLCNYGESIDEIINLALLIDKLFNSGQYKILKTHQWIVSSNIGGVERSVRTMSNTVKFYVEKAELAGMLKIEERRDHGGFRGEEVELVKLPPEFLYKIRENRLQKIDLNTGKLSCELGVSYWTDFRDKKREYMEVIRPLTTQQALDYLTRELSLTL